MPIVQLLSGLIVYDRSFFYDIFSIMTLSMPWQTFRLLISNFFFVCVCLIIIIVTMFRNTYQKGFLTVFSSTGSKPLANWSSHVKNGHIKRITDCDLTSLVLELMGRNVATTYICTPCPGYCSLGIKLPFVTLIVKNLKKFFTFEIQVRFIFLCVPGLYFCTCLRSTRFSMTEINCVVFVYQIISQLLE